ncbi:hypothetical protein EV421DRAFT_1908785 [Armillaria borealis]|uniref:Uncharacterized protein n=1 Tax=Armillaria borealis TaxID=47425 RepID=A0AA39J389_9AGAR|nr:hypothetical protein EV421DRAFT_1908785 [Armillaria borealis]
MVIFKRIKHAIATWLLETNSESEDADHKENPSAASSAGEIPLTVVPNLDRIAPINSRETGGYSQVPESHLIDALWHNRSERQQIRLGRFLRAYEVHDQEDPEEFLVNPHSLEFNSEVEKALRPHRQILADLVDSPNEVDNAIVPAKVWLKSLKKQPLVLHWNGGLTLNNLARINDYFFRHVLKMCKECPIDWATGLAISHARTLLITYRHQDLFLQDEDCTPISDIEAVNHFVGQKAWDRLVGYTGCTTDGKPKPDVVDVDMEALIPLEMRMFDRSEDAGVAGNHQWGLDAGMHQDGWYPWSSDGPEGEKNSHEGNESELEVGPEFD